MLRANLECTSQMLRRIAANAVKNRFIVRAVYAAIVAAALLILYKRCVAPWLWVRQAAHENGPTTPSSSVHSVQCAVPPGSIALFGGEDLSRWDYSTAVGGLVVANCSGNTATAGVLSTFTNAAAYAKAVVLWFGDDVVPGREPEKVAQEIIWLASNFTPAVLVMSTMPRPAKISRFRDFARFDRYLSNHANGSLDFADFWGAIGVSRPADDESAENVSALARAQAEQFFEPAGDVLSSNGYRVVSNLVRAHLSAIGVLV
mmetsp:Transcript_41309/g.99113  ORF Transcript_41309/g.99113 Transcript_41309/m.99113 type:complete len:260 (+) Transcript_41309:584-1363(+)